MLQTISTPHTTLPKINSFSGTGNFQYLNIIPEFQNDWIPTTSVELGFIPNQKSIAGKLFGSISTGIPYLSYNQVRQKTGEILGKDLISKGK